MLDMRLEWFCLPSRDGAKYRGKKLNDDAIVRTGFLAGAMLVEAGNDEASHKCRETKALQSMEE